MGRKKQEKEKQEEPEVFHVEVITAARVADDFSWEYRVKWAGYDSDADSWEPSENVAGCDTLLKRFWIHIGVDDQDYPAGHICEADASFIKKERKQFARNFPKVLKLERERAKAEKSNAASASSTSTSSTTTRKRKRGRKPTTVVPEPTNDNDDTSTDEPLSKRLRSRSRTKSPSASPPVPEYKGKGKQRAIIATPPPPPVESNESYDLTGLFSPASSPSHHQSEFHTSPPAPPVQPVVTVSEAEALHTNKTKPSSPILSDTPFPIPAEQRRWGITKPAQTSTTAGSTMTTKQRLAQSALEIQRAMKPAKVKVKFKKLSETNPDLAPSKSMAPPASSIAPPAPPPPPSVPPLPRRGDFMQSKPPGISPTIPSDPRRSIPREPPVNVAPIVAQPVLPQVQSWDTAPHEDEPPAAVPDGLPTEDDFHMEDYMADAMLESPIESAPPAQPDETDQFLNSIMPPELAAPMPESITTRPPLIEASEPPEEVHLPAATILRNKLPALPKIEKKYSWHGPLMSKQGDELDHICNVTIDDLSPPIAGCLLMEVFLKTMDSLVCEGLYDQADVQQVLLACKPQTDQFARLVSSQDAPDLAALATTLNKRNQAMVVSLHLDKKVVAFLIVLPTGVKHIVRRLSVPTTYLQNAKTLTVALVAMSIPNHAQLQWRKPLEDSLYTPPVDVTRFRHGSKLHTALQILQFPQHIYDFMKQGDRRPYCVWWEGGDGSGRRGRETEALYTILEHCGGKDVGLKADVRVVFAHIASINTLHRLPGFLERRTKRPEINFYTYGTHHRVSPTLWGVRPVYPVGGIVTFTPSALLADPEHLRRRIAQIAQHELWACYVLPSVIGLASKLSAQDKDPLTLLANGELFTTFLLKMIEEGQLAMMSCPPLEPHLASEHAPKWFEENQAQLEYGPEEYLHQAMNAFHTQYANRPEREWLKIAESTIRNDLRKMEMQPCIMSEYRRFVVIQGPQEGLAPNDGFEWVTVENFDFRDNSFDKGDLNLPIDEWTYYPF